MTSRSPFRRLAPVSPGPAALAGALAVGLGAWAVGEPLVRARVEALPPDGFNGLVFAYFAYLGVWLLLTSAAPDWLLAAPGLLAPALALPIAVALGRGVPTEVAARS